MRKPRPARLLAPFIPLGLILSAGAALAAEDEVVVANKPVKAASVSPQTTGSGEITATTTAKTTQADVLAAVSGRPVERTSATSAWGSADDTWGSHGLGDEKPKREIHGEAGASIGSRGYKSAYVSALIPVGETGTLGIAVSQTDFGKNNVYVPYGTPGYGRYGGWGYAQGGTSQSLSLSFDFSDRNRRANDDDEDCDRVSYAPSLGDARFGGLTRSRTCTKTTWYND